MERVRYRKLSEADRINALIEDLSKPINEYRLLDVDECDAPLLIRALKTLKHKAPPKTEKIFEHSGCRLERMPGSKLGRRGMAKRKFGYRITHISTGETTELAPTADSNITPKSVKRYVETWSKLCELEADK